MAMVVKNNMSAVSTLNTLNKNSSALQKSLAKVSSGMKINSAQDDASGYAISEKMRVQIRSLDQANQNTQNASSMMKTAEGAVSSTVEILKSLKEKAINAATDTNTDSDRKTIQKEIDQFIDQIDDNALTTFNGKYMVDGSKQQQGNATYTAMTNQSLDKATNGATKLTDLQNRNGDSLEIASTDWVTASFVMNGNTYTTKFNVGSETNLQDVFNKLNSEYTNKGGTGGVFGTANTDTSAAAATMDSDTASTTLSTATAADLFAAIGGTDATATNIKTAISVLQDAGKLNSATVGFETDLTVAKTAVSDELDTWAGSVKTNVEATKATPSAAAAADSANPITLTADLQATIADSTGNLIAATDVGGVSLSVTANTGFGVDTASSFALDANTTTDTLKSAVMASVDSVLSAAATSGTYTDGDATTAVTSGTTLTLSGISASSGTATWSQSSSNVFTAPSAVSSSKAEDYAKAYALSKMAGGAAGDAEVLSSTDIGINTAGDMVKTANGEVGLTVTAANPTIQHQISGVTISVADSEGQVKKSANASLDDFKTTIYAKNKSDRNELTFQVGAAANQSITVGLDDMRAEALGLKSSNGDKVSVATQDNANAAVAVFDNAIQKALDQQTTIGAVEARLEYTSNNLTTSSENVQAAESTIRDADMAKEMTAYTKNNVLLQAAQSMLAQANQSSSQVLSLLQ